MALLHAPQQWIFEELKSISDIDFKFKSTTPAKDFAVGTSFLMQQPIPREWLISGLNRLRDFDPGLIEKTIDCLRTDNLRLFIVSQEIPGNWDQKEKWYGTEYTVEPIPEDFMVELAEASYPKNRLPALHLPDKNTSIPITLEVEKKEVKEPALAPSIVRNDDSARTWWKKNDTFWDPRTYLLANCKNPIIFASPENVVKTTLYTDLVKDELEGSLYDAQLAGLRYNVGVDSRGFGFEVSGYTDRHSEHLKHVLETIQGLEIKDDRFDIVKEHRTREFRNLALDEPYDQSQTFMFWLNAEHLYRTEDYVAELPVITAETLRQFKLQLLGQLHVELYVNGNLNKEDALRLTDLVLSVLAPRPLPRQQWLIKRSLILPPGANYIYRKTLEDADNVNHCIHYWLYTGDRGDAATRARTELLAEMIWEPFFDQIRTKEQLGYIVGSAVQPSLTTYGLGFVVQSERHPGHLESRVDSFIESFGAKLEAMEEEEFENHKRSLIARLLEKLPNLSDEVGWHWHEISGEYYDFGSGKCRTPSAFA